MNGMKALRRYLTAVLFLFCFASSVFGATIDVMIVYDTTAKTWVDSHGGMNAFAADVVARMNQATANSNVNLTFRLAHAAEVSYTRSGSLSTDLNNITNGTGNLSIVHQWRDTYGADVVALLVDTGSAYGWVGVGWLLTSYSGGPDYGFTANAIQSVNISHTLTHEVGHNLGAHHSKYQTSDPGPNYYLNTYSAGWYFTGTNATKYHTIMAYDADGYGNYYWEAPLFSTPLLNYQGVAAGHAQDGDNARNIRGTMDVVAAYRSACDTTPAPFTFTDQTGVDLSQTITSNTITVSGITCASSISITGGTYSINGGAYTSAGGTVSNGNTVTVRQTSSGSYSTTTNATLTIGGVSDTFSVTTQTGPIIQVMPSSLNFGYVPPGSYKDLTLEVKNIGGGTLTGSVTVSPPFSIVSGGSYSLGTNQTQQVVVRYTAPLQEGSQTGSLTFTGGGGVTVQMKGTNKTAGLPFLMLLLGD